MPKLRDRTAAAISFSVVGFRAASIAPRARACTSMPGESYGVNFDYDEALSSSSSVLSSRRRIDREHDFR